MEKLGKRFVKHADPKSIQVTISVSFTITAVCIMCFLGVLLYQQFARKTELLYAENTEQLLNQTAISLEDYLRSMRRICGRSHCGWTTSMALPSVLFPGGRGITRPQASMSA